jgi:hypothetical protein
MDPRYVTIPVCARKWKYSSPMFWKEVSDSREPKHPSTASSISPAIPAPSSVSVKYSKFGSVVSDETPTYL